ncbi:hypothetical protein ACFVVQ_13055 [Paenibacillus chitinolyticus]|uniref:hypothetical protein n=1 Tax=Paenibacillus chitinolyticus TaxID=79263 RepID=UPI0036DB8486
MRERVTAERRAGPPARAWDSARAEFTRPGRRASYPAVSRYAGAGDQRHAAPHRDRELNCAALGVTGFSEMILISFNTSYSIRYINTLLSHFNE